jgi:hypothetical protein
MTARRQFGVTAAGLIALALFLAGAGRARADVIISNLPTNDSNAFAFSGGQGLGEEFRMGATPYALDSVELRLAFVDVANARLQVALYGPGPAGRPGPLLATFTNPSLGDDHPATYTFALSSPFTLEANTLYWLVTNALPGSSIVDAYGSLPAVTPTGPGATYVDQAFGFGNPPTGPGTGQPSGFQVNGTPGPAPEPRALALFALGAAGLALGARRRKAKAFGRPSPPARRPG